MVAYQLASKHPAACLERDSKQQTPIQLAEAGDKGEVRWARPGLPCSACTQRCLWVRLAGAASLLAYPLAA